MATIHGVTSFRLQDFLGATGSMKTLIQFSDATTVAQLITDVQALAVLLDPCTDAMGLQARVEFTFASTGLKTAITTNNTLVNGALFSYSQSGGNRYIYSEEVPAFAETKITNGKIDLGNSDVINLKDWYLNGGAHILAESNAYNTLAAFRYCKLGSRSDRRVETKVSFEPAG